MIGEYRVKVEGARPDFSYTREYIDGWIEHFGAVREATAEALAGRRPWPEIVAELSARYPEEYPRSLDLADLRPDCPAWPVALGHGGIAGGDPAAPG